MALSYNDGQAVLGNKMWPKYSELKLASPLSGAHTLYTSMHSFQSLQHD